MNRFISSILIVFSLVTSCFAGVTFDGVNDGINLGDIDGFDGQLTIAAWIRIHTSTDDSAILSQWDGVNANSSFLFRISTSANPAFVTNNGGGTAQFLCTETITLNQWVHVAAVYQGSTNADVYINGTECASYSLSTAVDIGNEVTTIWIGRRVDANDEADGDYLEVTAWNTALSAANIMLLAQNRVIRFPLQISPSNILIDFPLDECGDGENCLSNWTVFRSIASGNTGGGAYAGPQGFANPVLTYQ